MTLELLRLKDFKLVEDLSAEFGEGLCLITGETGAGKSIIVGALGLLAGARADSDVVRSGSRESIIEGVFSLQCEGWDGAAWFRQNGIDYDGEIVIRRTISHSGRGSASVNGALVPLSKLKELGQALVRIHGQHQSQSLLDEEEHRRFFDALPGLDSASEATLKAHGALQSAIRTYTLATAGEAERAARAASISEKLREIASVSPKAGEEADLRSDKTRQMHAGRIAGDASAIRDLLRDGETSALSALAESLKRARALAEILPEWVEIASEMETAATALHGAAFLAEAAASSALFDPEALERVESRLADLERIKRKYGPTLDDVLKLAQSLEEELAAVSSKDADPQSVKKELDRRFEAYLTVAGRLSKLRREVSSDFSHKVQKELKELSLEKARFSVEISPIEPKSPSEASPFGLEGVRFLFSANPGEPEKPLSKVASGGELSRVMLAVLTALKKPSGPETVVFDEVDSGIGGSPAEKIGRRLRDLSRGGQVLCVTHLPQIAAFADRHTRIEKHLTRGKAVISAKMLEDDERQEELARMLAGETVTDSARKHAWELLQMGKK